MDARKLKLSTLDRMGFVRIKQLNKSQKVTHLVRSLLNLSILSLGSLTCGPTACENGRGGVGSGRDVELGRVTGMGVTTNDSAL